jgi:hypothetical protein
MDGCLGIDIPEGGYLFILVDNVSRDLTIDDAGKQGWFGHAPFSLGWVKECYFMLFFCFCCGYKVQAIFGWNRYHNVP